MTGRFHSAHPAWVAGSQLWIRLLTALKFFLVGREIGPGQVGIFAIGLLVLAVVEAATESGLQAALIQRQTPPDNTLMGAAWTALLARGALIGTGIFVAAPYAAMALGDASAQHVIEVMALIAILKSAQHLGLTCLRRDRGFRTVGLVDGGAITVDVLVALALAWNGAGALALAWSAVAGEALRTLLSWTACRRPQTLSLKWRLLRQTSQFGAWIWGSSLLTLLVNQIDKIFVSQFLGTTQLGIYQMSTRISQLFITDAAAALSQYLFPTLAQMHRNSPERTLPHFKKLISVISIGALVIAGIVFLFSQEITTLLLGPKWGNASDIVGYAVIQMALGAPNTVLVPYLRAIGKPQIATRATLNQLIVLCALGWLLTPALGIPGLIVANTLAVGCATLTMSAYVFFKADKQ